MLIGGWVWPSPRAVRAAIVEGYLQGYAPGETVVVSDVPYQRAVCPCCYHVTDDEMLLDLTRLDEATKAALGIPVGPEAWCNNVCLRGWQGAGGNLAGLYEALGAPADLVASLTAL
ncbi:MAG: hypothetical protein HOQ12_00540 [Gemmatimonadaceae bacterium]|nr:hypothetical protein [Gemmatimonadaceae bacterium]NUR17996.1 hypothetical protein [Gemmatimonadaceae bacterium]